MRQGYYQAMDEPGDPSSIYLNQTAFVGKAVERALIDRWKSMGIYVDSGVKFFNRDVILSGEMDAILKNPLTNTLYGCEVKTYYGYKAERGLKGVKREQKTGRAFYGKPKDYQFLQALLYAWEYREELPEYRLYYFERGTGERFEFEVGLDRTDPTQLCWWRQMPGADWTMFDSAPVMQPFSVKDVHDRYITLLQYARDRELPPRDYQFNMEDEEVEYRYEIGEVAVGAYEKWKKNSVKYPIPDWHCGWCRFSATCRRDN